MGDFAVGILSLLALTVPRILRKHLVERTSLCCSGLTVKWLPSALLAEVSFVSACSSTSPSVCSKALGGAGIFPAVLGEISRARLCSGRDSRCGDCVGEGFFLSVLRIIFENVFIQKNLDLGKSCCQK